MSSLAITDVRQKQLIMSDERFVRKRHVIFLPSIPALPPSLAFLPHFPTFVIEAKASGPQHALQVWLGVSNDMLPVKHFCSTKPLPCISRI